MKNLLKSKTMILFMVLVLGVIYTNSVQVHKLESDSNNTQVSQSIN